VHSAKGAAAHRQSRKEPAGAFGGALDTAVVLRVILNPKGADAGRQGRADHTGLLGGAIDTAVLKPSLESASFWDPLGSAVLRAFLESVILLT